MKDIRLMRRRTPRRALSFLVVLLCAVAAAPAPLGAQEKPKPLAGKDRERGLQILEIVREGIREHYYDPNFRGMDLKARFEVAKARIKKAASNGEIFSIVAGLLAEFNDSHLYFIPPDRAARVEYGWRMQMIGDKCYVVEVKPGSDAEKKGLKVGDEVWSIDGYEPTRENLWKIKYSYYTLKPRPAMRVVVQDPGAQRELLVMSKFVGARDFFDRLRKRKETAKPAPFHEVPGELFVWKMDSFAVEGKEVDEVMRKALPHKAMILDLRGNGGGYEETLLRLLGYFFDREVKLGELKRRRGTKTLVAKPRGRDKHFAGRLVVLVDSGSGSAAELFARVVQLEKRGTVVGDRSAGAVMRSRLHGESTFRGTWDNATLSFFAVSITDADITMTDGRSLEHVGVTPDELLLPAGADLAAGRDPVLARAAALAGVKLDPQQAGALFPRVGRDEEDDEEKDDEGGKGEGDDQQ
jgi:carboxyl-terminal processing protease